MVWQQLSHGPQREEAPAQGIRIPALDDGLEVQMAARGPTRGTHLCDGLPDLHLVTRTYANRFQVVVGGDEAIAVVNLHPVAASPGVPARRPDDARIRRVNRGPARRGIVLSQVEVSRKSAQRADPESERRTRVKDLQRCHQEPDGGPANPGRANRQSWESAIPGAADCRVGKGKDRVGVGQDGRRQLSRSHLVRSHGGSFRGLQQIRFRGTG